MSGSEAVDLEKQQHQQRQQLYEDEATMDNDNGDAEKLETGIDKSQGCCASSKQVAAAPAAVGQHDDEKGDEAFTQRDPERRRGEEVTIGGGGLGAGDDDEEHHDDNSEDAEPNGVIERVLSRITSGASYDPGPPPDGGWAAWMQCLSAHLVIMNTWGFINSFGTFQTYYTAQLGLSPSAVSWLGSLSIFLLFFIGTFTGRLVDAGFFRALYLLGSALLVLGIFAVSACTRYWQLVLAQGLCLGIANGCLFCPTMATLSTYFDKKRAIALGMAACGSATGGLIFPSIVRQLLPTIGFPWTIRVIGFIQAASMVVVNLMSKPRIKPRRAGPIVDWEAFKELEYTFYACGSFFCFWGLYFAFFYVSSFARDALNPPLSYPDSLNVLLVINGVGILGRLGPNYMADRLGPVNLFIPFAALASLMVLCWMAVHSSQGLYAWAVLYGLAGGGIQSLFPAALSSLTTDLRRAGVRMGMVFTIVSFAVLTGPPIAGAIIGNASTTGGEHNSEREKKGYDGAQGFAGAVIAVGCCFIIAAKVARMRKTGLGLMSKM